MNQKTISKDLHFFGKGIHTGHIANVTVKPAESSTGVLFYRSDCKEYIKASLENVVANMRNTCIGKNGVYVNTIEHIMAAFYVTGVDNAVVEIDSDEMPILDGSSKEFAKSIMDVGLLDNSEALDYWVLREEVLYDNGFSSYKFRPCDGFQTDITIEYPNEIIGTQKYSYKEWQNNAVEEILPARTFVLLSEILYLAEKNLIKGGNIDTAVVITDIAVDDLIIGKIAEKFNANKEKVASILAKGDTKTLSKEGSRFQDEICRHKLLDFLGDLYLLNKRVKVHIEANKTGHKANVEVAKILSQKLIKES